MRWTRLLLILVLSLVVAGGFLIALHVRSHQVAPEATSITERQTRQVDGVLNRPGPDEMRTMWLKAVNANGPEIQVLEAEILQNPSSHVGWLGDLLQQQVVEDSKSAEFTAILLAKIGTADSAKGLINAYEKVYGVQVTTWNSDILSRRENFLNV